jgi:hypothetical protein
MLSQCSPACQYQLRNWYYHSPDQRSAAAAVISIGEAPPTPISVTIR